MYHSMYINDKNTWDDYALVPSEKIYFPTAQQKTKVVEIEGASGALDFSTLLTGYPIYANRNGSITFYLLDAVDAKTYANAGYPYPQNYTFYDIFDKIRGELDGRQSKIWLEDDPDWYYEGRINVATTMTQPRPTAVISYDIGPYKISKNPVAYETHGAGSLQTMITIPKEVGTMPSSLHFTLSGGQGTIRFYNEATGINETGTFAPGTYDIFEWVIFGETKIYLSAAVDVTLHVEYYPGRL